MRVLTRQCTAKGEVAANALTAMYYHVPNCWLHPPSLDPMPGVLGNGAAKATVHRGSGSAAACGTR